MWLQKVSLGDDAGTFRRGLPDGAGRPRRSGPPCQPRSGSNSIKQIGRLFEANKEALARLVTREIGKTYTESLGEVQEVIDTCDFFTGEGRRLYGQTVPSEMPDKQLFTFRMPVGGCGDHNGRQLPDRRPFLVHSARPRLRQRGRLETGRVLPGNRRRLRPDHATRRPVRRRAERRPGRRKGSLRRFGESS